MRAPFTELRALHNGSGVLGEALAALPGYTDASAALRQAEVTLNAHLQAMVSPAQGAGVARVLELLDAGKPLPKTLAVDTWQAVHAQEANVQLEHVFSAVLQELSSRRDQVVEAGRDAMLEHLDGAVRACVEEARGLELAGSRTADEALDAGAGEAWRRMRELRSRYADIRRAQTTTFRVLASSGGQSPLSTVGFLQNLDELVPNWADIQRGRVTVFADGQAQETSGGGRYPWLPPTTDLLEEDVEDDDALRFDWLVATPAAVPWVPTPAQLEEARKAAEEAFRSGAPKPDVRVEAKVRRQMENAQASHQAEMERQSHFARGGMNGGQPW